MADRLGQEKDNKRSKTLLTVAVVLVVLNVLLFFLVPTQIFKKFQKWQGVLMLCVYAAYVVMTVRA